MRRLMCFSILLLVTGLLLGVLSPSIFLNQSLGTTPASLLDMPRFQIFLLIARKNAKSLIMLWGGALTFGVTTLHNLMVNSLIIGAVLKTAVMQMGLSKTLLLILPHGIFEIPGMIIAGTAGFKIPYELLRFALGKKEEIISEEDAKEFFKLVLISVILIFIAALIESTVTAKIAERI